MKNEKRKIRNGKIQELKNEELEKKKKVCVKNYE